MKQQRVAIRAKKPPRELSLKRRNSSGFKLTANDQVKVEKSMRTLRMLLWIKMLRPGAESKKVNEVIRFFMVRHCLLTHTVERGLEPCRPDRKRTIDSWILDECEMDFRFDNENLHILCRELRFPDIVRFDNGMVMSGEEVFLRGLYELVSGEVKNKVAKEFGREWSAQSRAFNFFIDYMYNTFSHLVHDNLEWWYRNGFWERSAAAIEFRMRTRYIGIIRNQISHFIDCKCEETSVIGGGPAEQGANAARWDEDIQRAFYNGWKSIHGIKHQTIENAFGMCEDIYGPESVRENDLTLLRLSRINNRFRELQVNDDNANQYLIFGDSAYIRLSHLETYYSNVPQQHAQFFVQWNKAMKHVRISIEWNYAVTSSLFKYVNCPEKLKMLQSTRVSKIYTIATLFRNFHVAVYGSQSSKYFNLAMPPNMLIAYINQLPVYFND